MLWRFRREVILALGVFFSLLLLNYNFRKESAGPAPGELGARIVNYEEIVQENRRLRKILDLQERSPGLLSQAVAAEVTSIQPMVCPGELRVNKGKEDGITRDMIAVSLEGSLLGQVVDVAENTATVFTVFHPRTKISVITESGRELGVLEGGSFPYLTLKYLKRDSTVAPGDGVVTSGFSQYPRGLKVGKIVSVERTGGGFFVAVRVEPLAGFSHLEEVLIGK